MMRVCLLLFLVSAWLGATDDFNITVVDMEKGKLVWCDSIKDFEKLEVKGKAVLRAGVGRESYSMETFHCVEFTAKDDRKAVWKEFMLELSKLKKKCIIKGAIPNTGYGLWKLEGAKVNPYYIIWGRSNAEGELKFYYLSNNAYIVAPLAQKGERDGAASGAMFFGLSNNLETSFKYVNNVKINYELKGDTLSSMLKAEKEE